MPRKPAETLGQRLRRLRIERDLTQRDLAGSTYAAAYVSQVESDKRQPSDRALAHFASVLEVDLSELKTGRPAQLIPELRLLLEAARKHVYAGDPSAAKIGFEQVAKKARENDLGSIRARAEEGLGLLARRAGDGETGLRHYRAALDLLATELPPARAEAVVGAARCYRILGETRYASHVLESYLVELTESGLTDPTAIMLTKAALVTTYFSLGMYKQAWEAGEHSMRLAPQVKDPSEVANMHINVAQVLLHRGLVTDALAALDRARDTYAALEWDSEVARALNAQAIVLRENGDLERAREVLVQARDLLHDAPSRLEEGRVLNELARVERLSGNSERALELLEDALPLLSDSDVLERAFREREIALCLQEERDKAEAHLKIALELYGRSENARETAQTFRALGDLYRDGGDLQATCDAYARALDSALSA